LIAWTGVVRSAKFAGLTLARLWQARSLLARNGALQRARADMRRAKVFGLALVSLILALQVFAVATYPGELLHRLPPLPFIPWPDGAGGFPVRLASLHELLFAEGANLAERRPQGLLSNRIVLPGLNVIDRTKFDSEAKIAALPESVSLRARHLEGAVLIGATLFNADFTAADLTGAKLDEADLRGARLDCAEREQGGKVMGARRCARLDGASLTGAVLQGASLAAAQLRNADLSGAKLQGASFDRAQMQGAVLDNASLQGASLNGAQLQAGSLKGAQLQGASLVLTELQGASLAVAQLHQATLVQVFAWRADVRTADAFEDTQRTKVDARVIARTDAKKYCSESPDNACDWSPEWFEALKQVVPLEKIQHLDKIARPEVEDEKEMAAAWDKLAGTPPPSNAFERKVRVRLRDIGCAAEGAPYVVRGMIRTAQALGLPGNELSGLAKAFLDKDCGSAYGLTEADKTKLTDLGRPQSVAQP
jgi:uncharacterized protein YjbI with pentapeptide repeats